MGKQSNKEKPKEVIFVECGGVSYLHKEFQYHSEAVFIDKEDPSQNWRDKYLIVPIVEEIEGQEIVHQEYIVIFDGSAYGKKMGYPPR